MHTDERIDNKKVKYPATASVFLLEVPSPFEAPSYTP
jgi:hypothetical protein